MIERITGPFHGYHIAAYACPMGDLGQEYIGHFKISEVRPESFWETGGQHQGCCVELSATSDNALCAAELCAMEEVDRLASDKRKVRHWSHAIA